MDADLAEIERLQGALQKTQRLLDDQLEARDRLVTQLEELSEQMRAMTRVNHQLTVQVTRARMAVKAYLTKHHKADRLAEDLNEALFKTTE